MKKNLLTAAIVFYCVTGCGGTSTPATKGEPTRDEKLAEHQGWLENYNRGRAIVKELSVSRSEDPKKKTDIAAYRGERVAFVGAVAPSGGTNDLITEEGFYLRLVNKEGKDLRPHSCWWEVLVCGEIWQVLPENKIIVIEVAEKDWIILQTG